MVSSHSYVNNTNAVAPSRQIKEDATVRFSGSALEGEAVSEGGADSAVKAKVGCTVGIEAVGLVLGLVTGVTEGVVTGADTGVKEGVVTGAVTGVKEGVVTGAVTGVVTGAVPSEAAGQVINLDTISIPRSMTSLPQLSPEPCQSVFSQSKVMQK